MTRTHTAPLPSCTAAVMAELAVEGVQNFHAPLARTAGAGPSDDGHVLFAGKNTSLPIRSTSSFTIEDGTVHRWGINLGLSITPVSRPAFYDLATADGVPYSHIAQLHGANVLATTVIQTCIRYHEDLRCRFCAIEESLRNNSTIAVKRPQDLAQVAQAAYELDGITTMVMTTGTPKGNDRGAKYLAQCVAAVKQVVPAYTIQVQCEPPQPLSYLQYLKDAGADSIGIHVESLDDAVRRNWMPGKSTIALSEYWAAWEEAVRVFGHNQVSTYLLIGLGEDPDELVTHAQRLIDIGVYPFVVPFRPLAGTLAVEKDHATAPDPRLVHEVSSRIADLLKAAQMHSSTQKAGCASCGACSLLPLLGG